MSLKLKLAIYIEAYLAIRGSRFVPLMFNFILAISLSLLAICHTIRMHPITFVRSIKIIGMYNHTRRPDSSATIDINR